MENFFYFLIWSQIDFFYLTHFPIILKTFIYHFNIPALTSYTKPENKINKPKKIYILIKIVGS